MRLLHRLGLKDRLRDVAIRPYAIEMRRWEDNSVLHRTPLGAQCEQYFGAPYYTVHRADLHRCLLERLPTGILHLGMHCTGVQESPENVQLQFANGSSITADLVVGADGIHSRMRELLIRASALDPELPLPEPDPELFDHTRARGCERCFLVLHPDEFTEALVAKLEEARLCAVYDGEELAVKSTNAFNDQFDVLTFEQFLRRENGSYRSTCRPAWF